MPPERFPARASRRAGPTGNRIPAKYPSSGEGIAARLRVFWHIRFEKHGFLAKRLTQDEQYQLRESLTRLNRAGRKPSEIATRNQNKLPIPGSEEELGRNARSVLKRTQRNKARVKSYFGVKYTQYAR